MDFRQITIDLQKEFANKKIKAEEIASKNYAKAMSNASFCKLCNLERLVAFELSKQPKTSEKFKEYKQNLQEIRLQKLNVLKRLKLTVECLKPKYDCDICKDVGYVNGSMCECFKKRKNEELAKAFGLALDTHRTLEKFDTKICKNELQAENLNKLAKILKKWANNYPENTKYNFVLSGKTGVGKSYITECLANEMINKGYNVCFVSAYSLNESFLKYRTTFDSSKTDWLEPFIYSDFLFVDDLGTEPPLKNVTNEYLYLVLSERARYLRPTIITTNLNPAELLNQYGERIYSRLSSKITGYIFQLGGDDLRISK